MGGTNNGEEGVERKGVFHLSHCFAFPVSLSPSVLFPIIISVYNMINK